MQREFDVLVTVKLTVTAIHQTDAQRIAAEKIRLAVSAIKADVVATES